MTMVSPSVSLPIRSLPLDDRADYQIISKSPSCPVTPAGKPAPCFKPFSANFEKAEWQRGIENHQRIIDLLRDQNVTGASDVLGQHIESHKKRMGV